MEKQRIRFHYNVNNKYLDRCMQRAFRRGIDYPVDNFLQQLESRLDNFCWRVGIAPTMAGARNLVRTGNLQIFSANKKAWRTVNIPSIRLKIGEKVRVKPEEKYKNVVAKNMESSTRNVQIPSHIAWDVDKLEGHFEDICDHKDVGLDIEESYICRYYSGPTGIRRPHIRIFPGTSRPIPRKRGKGDGHIRPTPENLLNMKRGLGLGKKGRSRPPSLWGRKYPVNSPYHK